MIKHSQITQSNKFAISLQYHKKEVWNGVHFWHADKSQSFYKLVLYFLAEVTRHVQNTQNRKLVIFLQYIKKKCCNCFVFSCEVKHSDILQGSSHVHCYMLLWQFPYKNFKALYAMVEVQNYKYSKFTSNDIALLILLTKQTNILPSHA